MHRINLKINNFTSNRRAAPKKTLRTHYSEPWRQCVYADVSQMKNVLDIFVAINNVEVYNDGLFVQIIYITVILLYTVILHV